MMQEYLNDRSIQKLTNQELLVLFRRIYLRAGESRCMADFDNEKSLLMDGEAVYTEIYNRLEVERPDLTIQYD